MTQLIPLFVYREPCPKFRSHIVSAIKSRNPYKLMRVMRDGKDSFGLEGMTQVLANFILKDTPLKWEEITEDDVSFLEKFSQGIVKNKGKIKRSGNNRNKSKGFGSNRA
jgi:hypothetical protein